MADQTIGSLPVADTLEDDSLLVVEQLGEARSIQGLLVKKFAETAAKEQADIATEAASNASESKEVAEKAASDATDAKNAVENMTVSAKTLSPGSKATVTKTIKQGVVNLEYGLPTGESGPQGPAGKDGKSAYQDAVEAGYTGTEADFNAALAYLPSMWMLEGGTAITQAGDLNSYTAVGNYYCGTSSVAAAMQNCPVQKAFFLKVFNPIGVNSNYFAQLIMSYSDMRPRMRISSYGSFGPWIEFAFLTDLTLSQLGITASIDELNYVDGVTAPLQTQISNRLLKNFRFSGSSGSAYTFAFQNADASSFGSIGGYGSGGIGARLFMGFGDSPWLPENALIVSPTDLKYKNNDVYHAGNPPALSALGITATANELNYVSGVTSNIQNQLNAITAQIGDIGTQLDAINGEVV